VASDLEPNPANIPHRVGDPDGGEVEDGGGIVRAHTKVVTQEEGVDRPPEVADRARLRRLLLEAPEDLSEMAADCCAPAGIGSVREPVDAWRAAHTPRDSG
jgi:hypothetical protein